MSFNWFAVILISIIPGAMLVMLIQLITGSRSR